MCVCVCAQVLIKGHIPGEVGQAEAGNIMPHPHPASHCLTVTHRAPTHSPQLHHPPSAPPPCLTPSPSCTDAEWKASAKWDNAYLTRVAVGGGGGGGGARSWSGNNQALSGRQGGDTAQRAIGSVAHVMRGRRLPPTPRHPLPYSPHPHPPPLHPPTASNRQDTGTGGTNYAARTHTHAPPHPLNTLSPSPLPSFSPPGWRPSDGGGAGGSG